MGWVDDVNRFPESNEVNNKFFKSVVISNQTPTSSPYPDVVITSLNYDQSTGSFSAVVKNQGTKAVDPNVAIGVGYHVDGEQQTWGDFRGPLDVGASVTIGSRGGSYIIPSGTHTIMGWVDDVNRFPESNEVNNKFFKSVVISSKVPTSQNTLQYPVIPIPILDITAE